MRRWLRRVPFAIDTTICIALITLWVRSHWVEDYLKWQLGDWWQLSSKRGALVLFRHQNVDFVIRPGYNKSQPPSRRPPGTLGFHFDHDVGTASPLITTVVGVPYWFLNALSAAPLIIGWRRARHERATQRERQGLCRSCGYSLTGNVSGVCPECGTAIPAPAGDPAAPAR